MINKALYNMPLISGRKRCRPELRLRSSSVCYCVHCVSYDRAVSQVDNFEWAYGFAKKFGLYEWSQRDPSNCRTLHASSKVTSWNFIIAQNMRTDLRKQHAKGRGSHFFAASTGHVKVVQRPGLVGTVMITRTDILHARRN